MIQFDTLVFFLNKRTRQVEQIRFNTKSSYGITKHQYLSHNQRLSVCYT